MPVLSAVLAGSMAVACSAQTRALRGDGGVSPNLAPPGPPRRATGGGLETDITARLNDALGVDDRGVVVRVPDFLDSDDAKPAALPATLWRSDIYPPNQLYTEDGFAKPHVGYAVDPDMWDAVVLDTFYPRDSNSCDAVQKGKKGAYGRCFWDDSGSVWNCPGAYISESGEAQADAGAVGASANDCRGCHVGYDGDQGWLLDQDFDVVGDYDCNCPDMDYSQDQVCEWVQSQLIDTGRFGEPGLISSADLMTCWVDDVVALRSLQNCYYWKYYGDNWGNAMYEWAGWNEIGAAPEVDDPPSWQAIVIYLPAQLADMGLADLDPSMQQEIQDTILDYSKKEWLKIGFEHIKERPGSYVVMANEYKDDDPANPNFYHYFFCQSWTPDVPNPEIQICFLARGDDPDGNGYCYLERSSQPCM